MKKNLCFIFISIFIFLEINLYAETKTIICTYKNYADEKGYYDVKDKFKLTFVIDRENKTQYMMGPLGSTEVQMITSEQGYTFIEITTVGNIMTTTIDAKNKTVHSRNSVILGKLVPTQYYGTYEIL